MGSDPKTEAGHHAKVAEWSDLPLEGLPSRFRRFIPSDCETESKQVHLGTSPGRWVYEAAMLEPWGYDKVKSEPRNKLRPIEEIAAMVDQSPLDDLRRQAESALNQIFYRAHCADEKAIGSLALILFGFVGDLEDLEKEQPEKVGKEASKFARWPTLLSLNPQEIVFRCGPVDPVL